MNKWAKLALFAGGAFFGGLIEWWSLHQPSIGAIGAEPWALPEFQWREFNSPTEGVVDVSGSLMGKDVGYPVNTWNIDCIQTHMSCRVVHVEEIGRRQLGDISIEAWPVVTWTATAIVAQDAVGPTDNCTRNTITIYRQTKTVRYLSEPMNSGSDWCTKGRKILGPLGVEDWRIGNPKQPWGGYEPPTMGR